MITNIDAEFSSALVQNSIRFDSKPGLQVFLSMQMIKAGRKVKARIFLSIAISDSMLWSHGL